MTKKYSNDELIDLWLSSGPRKSQEYFDVLWSRISKQTFDAADHSHRLADCMSTEKAYGARSLVVKSARHFGRNEELLGYLHAESPYIRNALVIVSGGDVPHLPNLVPVLEGLMSCECTEHAFAAIDALDSYVRHQVRVHPDEKIELNFVHWLQALNDDRKDGTRMVYKTISKAAEHVLGKVCTCPQVDRMGLIDGLEKARSVKLPVKIEGRLVTVLATCAVANKDSSELSELFAASSTSLRQAAINGAAAHWLGSAVVDNYLLHGIDLRELMGDESLFVRLSVAELFLMYFKQFGSAESKTMKSHRTALFSGNIKKALPALHAIPGQALSEVDDCRNVALLSVAYLSYPDPEVQLAAAEVLSEATVMQAALPQVACVKAFIEPLLEGVEESPFEKALRQTVRSIGLESS